MNWIVIGYFTKNTFYEKHAGVFIKSLERLNIPYHVEGVDNLGSWHKNTSYKPTFIKQMLKKFPDKNIVYVDCDAEFMEYPVLFDELDCDIAVHNFDRRYHPNIKTEAWEILSGTIFLRNNETVYALVEKWERKCQDAPMTWDQKHLAKLIGINYYDLPGEYCKIYNLMKHIKNPVIVHYQASRTVRKRKGLLN